MQEQSYHATKVISENQIISLKTNKKDVKGVRFYHAVNKFDTFCTVMRELQLLTFKSERLVYEQ